MNETHSEPELVTKYTIRSDRGREIEVRIYRTSEISTSPLSPKQRTWRWHFGFPEKLVASLCPLLECTPYWGNRHWTELDGWWLWSTSIVCESPELSTVRELLTRELQRDLRGLNKCLKFFYKVYAKKAGDGPEATA